MYVLTLAKGSSITQKSFILFHSNHEYLSLLITSSYLSRCSIPIQAMLHTSTQQALEDAT